MRERGKIMKSVIRYEDMEGRTYATPAEAATADKIIEMRRLSNALIDDWQKEDPQSWTPAVDVLSVILQRLARRGGMTYIRKACKIEQKRLRNLAKYQRDNETGGFSFTIKGERDFERNGGVTLCSTGSPAACISIARCAAF